MRIQNEQSGSTSLFAQPMAIEPVPEESGNSDRELAIRDPAPPGVDGASGAAQVRQSPAAARLARSVLEARLEDTLAALNPCSASPSAAERQGHLALLKRWYYRPEVRRSGEIFFPDSEGSWPAKAILRGVGRVAAKALSQRT
jgi:excinuclease ABC subunit C